MEASDVEEDAAAGEVMGGKERTTRRQEGGKVLLRSTHLRIPSGPSCPCAPPPRRGQLPRAPERAGGDRTSCRRG